MSIQSLVREAEENYIQGTSKLGKYVDFSMYDTIETIDAYLSSKHITGSEDALGREKPFFNIVTASTNIWYRATDLDRKHIKIMPDSVTSVPLAFLGTVMLQRWMDKNRFGTFLNQWGRTLAKYGSAVVKFVERDGNLEPSVIAWNRFIADPIDFDAIPHIEKFYVTEAQLKKMGRDRGYNEEKIKEFCEAETTRKTLEGFQQDNENDFIEIYEVHCDMSLKDYKEAEGKNVKDGDEEEYFQQMHVVCFTKVNGEYKDFTLFCGREKKDPYMLTHLIKEDGRTLSIGSVEYLFDAQWMQNHSIKQWKDQLDLSSKLIFQTADKNFVGRNVLSAIENGDIMIHEPGNPLTLINNQGHDITNVQAFMGQWRVLSQEISNTPDVTRGITQAQPVTFGLGQIMNENSNSLFELMIENKALALEDMLKEFVLPHLKTKLNTTDEVMAVFDDNGIAELDALYIPREAAKRYNDQKIQAFLETDFEGDLEGNMEQVPEVGQIQNDVKNEMNQQGNKRFFSVEDVSWKEALSDLKWDNVKVEITTENKDKAAVLTSLTTIFQTLAQTDPAKANLVLNAIMTETGAISPLQLSSTASPPQMVGNQVGADMGALTAK